MKIRDNFDSLLFQEDKIGNKTLLSGMVHLLIFSLIVINTSSCCCQPPDTKQLSEKYVKNWKLFYPTEALAAGDEVSAYSFENYSLNNIREWLKFNEEIIPEITKNKYREKLSIDDQIDITLLEKKINQEIYKWKNEQVHLNSPSMYESLISQAFTHLLARPLKNRSGMKKAILTRLRGVSWLCDSAMTLLKNGPPEKTRGSVSGLNGTAEFYEKGLPVIINTYFTGLEETKNLVAEISNTVEKIRKLSSHISEKVIPGSTLTDRLGKEKYNMKLRLYTGLKIHSLKLQKIALDEIDLVREMIKKLSVEFFKSEHPGKYAGGIIPEKCIQYAFKKMESHRVENSRDFLKQFVTLINKAEKFIYSKNLTSLRDKRSLFTALSPAHFAGAAIGGVYAAGPFNPDADTLFYLPTVPDNSPLRVKDGFYRSFNNHFNTMIITHEIFPGHYLQLKEGSKNPRIVRTLFGDDLFIEGWATLCEQITLDNGWDNNNILTRLAHLRKRLENAVRAYTSVQVHCNGWEKERLLIFAKEKGLLAPQFAENLWHRVVNSPLQLTSYFLGFRQFNTQLEEGETKRGFSLQKFCDKILSSGSIPIDLLDEYL